MGFERVENQERVPKDCPLLQAGCLRGMEVCMD